MDTLTWAVVALAALLLVYVCLAPIGAWRWSPSRSSLVARLTAAVVPGTVARYDAADTNHLPDPVRRYFPTGTDRRPTHHSICRTVAAGHDQQAPFRAEVAAAQHVTTNRPGFVWDALITLFPGLPVRVTDTDISGRGDLKPAILGLFAVGGPKGDLDLAKAEPMRWFGEAVWYPTALLPSQCVTWAANDATSASATPTDGPVGLSLLFRFGTDGLIASVHAAERSAMVDGNAVMLPWECRLADHQSHSGMRMPMQKRTPVSDGCGNAALLQGND